MSLRSRVWTWLSQGINTFFLHGDVDESVSARAHREGWSFKVDRWLGKDHCRRVYEKQKAREAART